MGHTQMPLKTNYNVVKGITCIICYNGVGT